MMGTFGQVGYLSDVFQLYLPVWLTIPLFILPVTLVIFFQPNEVPEYWVRRIHVLAALWYVCFTAVIEVSSAFGYSPQGSEFFRILVHLGWLQFAPLLKLKNE